MNSFRNNRLRDHETPLSTVWLLNDIAESRGKQELFTRQSPQALKALRDTAVIQSAESSNRIEGVTVAQARRVNTAIHETLCAPDKSDKFYFYNNGITAVCDDHEPRSGG